MSLILDWIQKNAWAITEDALNAIIEIADREKEINVKNLKENDVSELFHKQALAARPGRRIEGMRYAYQRDSVGVLQVFGPIFPRANLMTEFSGAVSAQRVAFEFSKLVANEEIGAIVLDIDSPGGAITGVSELASLIYEARDVKPVYAFISGLGASAGYWIASAAEKVYISDTGEAGSIGVVATYRDSSKAKEKAGVKDTEIISSQSPFKRMGPETDEGREKIQHIVDVAADVFIKAVAKHRGVTTKVVMSDFGKGGLFLGKEAVTAGLADGVSTFEQIVAGCGSKKYKRRRKESSMDPVKKSEESTVLTVTVEGVKEGSPKTYNQIIALGRKEGAENERKRIAAIEALDAPGCEEVIANAKADPEATAESTAVAILKKQKEVREEQAKVIKSGAEQLDKKVEEVGASTPAEEAEVEKEKKTEKSSSNIAAGANEAKNRK